jgi:hypothetical protein
MIRANPIACSVVRPGIAPAVPVHPEQLQIVHRLHLIASSARPGQAVAVMAHDLLALLNGFQQESRRADVAEAQLAAFTTRDAA